MALQIRDPGAIAQKMAQHREATAYEMFKWIFLLPTATIRSTYRNQDFDQSR
jgi:hypothetical protein